MFSQYICSVQLKAARNSELSKTGDFSLVRNYLRPSNNSRQLIFNINAVVLIDIIQLLTIEALNMMRYRPKSTNIDRGGAEVNIGILRSISHHV